MDDDRPRRERARQRKQREEPESRERVQKRARKRYMQAMHELAAGSYSRAVEVFNQIAQGPSWVRYSGLARLRVGDALFLQQRFPEAINAYRTFLGQHGSSANVPYAHFRIAASYHRQMPDSWFAAPPAWQKDQAQTERAEKELESFLDRFPLSRFAEDARRMLRDVQRVLYRHELYVADYYAARDEWRAVAWRLDGAIDAYPERALKPDNVWRMAEAYDRVGNTSEAIEGFTLYLEEFPEAPRRDAAKRRRSELRKRDDGGSSG